MLRGDCEVVGDFDPFFQAFVVRRDVHAASRDAKFANHGGMSALKDFADLAFRAAIGADVGDTRDGAVGVHGSGESVASEEDIARDAGDRVVGDEEAIAVTVNGDSA